MGMALKGGRRKGTKRKSTKAKARGKGPSPLEAEMLRQMQEAGLPEAEREYKFHKIRRWRFDFAWPALMVAVEVHGGLWGRGRHNSEPGFSNDCEKEATAQIMGWKVIRVTSAMIKSGMAIDFVEEAVRRAEEGVA